MAQEVDIIVPKSGQVEHNVGRSVGFKVVLVVL